MRVVNTASVQSRRPELASIPRALSAIRTAGIRKYTTTPSNTVSPSFQKSISAAEVAISAAKETEYVNLKSLINLMVSTCRAVLSAHLPVGDADHDAQFDINELADV